MLYDSRLSITMCLKLSKFPAYYSLIFKTYYFVTIMNYLMAKVILKKHVITSGSKNDMCTLSVYSCCLLLHLLHYC